MIYQKFIKYCLEKVTEIANSSFGKVTGESKGWDNNQVLTKTDLEIGQYLIAMIQNTYPTHSIIDEEKGIIDNHSEYLWVLDPIDGTSNFANNVVLYGSMIGLLHKNKAVAGGIALPAFSEIYLAERGKGAICNNKPLRVTHESNLLSTLVAYTIDGHQQNPQITQNECLLFAPLVLGIRNLRASGSVYDAMMVARGNYGGYLSRSSKIWDNVAQQIIIEEAGGIYTDFFGKPMDYSSPLQKKDDNFTLCAGAPELHNQLQTIIHSIIS